MEKFSLYFSVNPHIVTQEWGIYNPIYLKFGFDHHPGIDLRLRVGQEIRGPIPSDVVRTGFEPEGAGYYVILRTNEEYLFDDGLTAFVEITFMHLDRNVVSPGQKVSTGELVGIGGSTGFSTGPHTHMRCRRVQKKDARFIYVDLNKVQNTFDQSKYWNGKYADTQTPPFVHVFTKDLVYGQVDEEVRFLQTALKLQKFFPENQEVTPFYGDITRDAVLKFQYKYKVDSIGVLWMLNGKRVGAKTRYALNRLFDH